MTLVLAESKKGQLTIGAQEVSEYQAFDHFKSAAISFVKSQMTGLVDEWLKMEGKTLFANITQEEYYMGMRDM